MKNGIATIGVIQTNANGIFRLTLSGSTVAMAPRRAPTISTVAVHPYQYIAGPSPLLAASHPSTIRFVAGWKVNSGRFQNRQTKYNNGQTIAKVIAKVLNLADVASDDVDERAETVVVVVVVMIRSPGYC